MFRFLGIFTRLLFTTPLGIVLLITAGVWYIMRSRDNAKAQEAKFENPSDSTTHEWRSDAGPADGIKHDHDAPKREAEDVDYTDLDE